MSEPTGRTLSSYRPQHDEDCATQTCANCDQSRDECRCQFRDDVDLRWTPKWPGTTQCTCGLDLLLAGTREGQVQEKDHARCDQPQPGSCAADPRGDDRGEV